LAFTATMAFMDRQSFINWGWRVPFIAGVFVIIIGIILRWRLAESPVFKAIKEKRKLQRVPSLQVFAKMPKVIVLVTASTSYIGATAYTVIAFSLGYLNALKAPSYIGTLSIMISGFVGVFVVIFSSHLGDRIGRRTVILFSQVLAITFMFPYFLLMNTLNPALIVMANVGLFAITQLAFAIFPGYFTEIFPAELRYSGSGLLYQFYNLIGGGLAPILSAYILYAFGGPSAWPFIAGLIIFYATVGLASNLVTRRLVTDFIQKGE